MFLPQRDRAKARDRSRACTPMHMHLCTHICAHASVHPMHTHLCTRICPHMHTRMLACSHVHSRHCVLLGASQAISLQFLPCHSCKGPCSGHLAI